MRISAYRRSMIAGIVFGVLFVVGVFTALDGPNTKSSDSAEVVAQKWVSWLSDSGNRAEHVVGAYLLILSAIAFIWFCLGLRHRVEIAGSAEAPVGRFVSALSVFGAGAIAAGAMTAAVVAGAVAFGDEKVPTDGDATHWITDMTFPFLFVVFGLVIAALIGAVSVSILRSGAFPRWVAYFGWLAVLGGLASVIFVPMVLPLLWCLTVAIMGIAKPAGVDVGQPVSASGG